MSVYNINGKEIGTLLTDIPVITGELPKIYITSNVPYASLAKETASDATVTFVDVREKFSLAAKIKLQGNNSLRYAKKNLNITFYNASGKKQKITFNSWYPTSKIHLKANEYDYAMIRNSVGTVFAYRMMGKMLPQGARGYIDSFPVIMFYNSEYMGCHTVNLPQDGKTYNFTDEQEEACTNMAYRCGTTTSWAVENWEYRGDLDETPEMRTAFTTFHSIIYEYNNLTKQIIADHFDVDTLIAYWTLADIMLAVDSLLNNWTLVTWDGIKWYHTWYDLDLIFGLGGNDGTDLAANYDITTCQQYARNGFWSKIVELYPTEIQQMYAKMRANGVNADTIYKMLHDFQSTWGWQNIDADRTKWASDKRNSNEISKTWIESRIAYLDNKYGYTL